jgi:hypothetical protein
VTVILFGALPAWRDRDATPSSLGLVIHLSGERINAISIGRHRQLACASVHAQVIMW